VDFAGKAHATNLSYPQARLDPIKRSSENLKIQFSDDLSLFFKAENPS